MVDPNIPPAPEIDGADHLHSGKVPDLYRITEGEYAGRLLMVASDRISAFDYVLDTTIPDKGAILTRLSLWWFDRLADVVANHVVSTDVPEPVKGRGLVCEELAMYPVECVARGYLTGSGLREYAEVGSVCGVPLPGGLVDGSRLPEAIFTPTTKGAVGEHDEAIDFDAVRREVGSAAAEELRDLTLDAYRTAEEIARDRGILLADTKFEFGRQGDGRVVLADEVLTPDSSRFWAAETWEPGGPQPSFDKDVVRNWLLHDSGWDRTSGERPPTLPGEVVERTRDRYVEAYERLTGETW